MPLRATAALEDHFVWLVTSYVFGGLTTMHPPANRVECSEAYRTLKHCGMSLLGETYDLQIIIAEVRVKKGSAEFLRRRAVSDTPRTYRRDLLSRVNNPGVENASTLTTTLTRLRRLTH